jgi:intracellular septation protein
MLQLALAMNKKALFHLFNEFAPVLAFFTAAQFCSFYVATGVFIISTLLALLSGWYLEKRLPVLPIISGFFVLISGFITIVHKIPDALIFADTLYYLLMGVALSIGLAFQVNILKLIFDRTFAMQNIGWLILARRWIIVFLLAGIANEIARHLLTPEIWINFKIVKVFSLTMFGLYQFTLSRRYRIPEISNYWGVRTE